MDVDMLIYVIGSLLIAVITSGFVLWAFKTKQFKENSHMKYKALGEGEEE